MAGAQLANRRRERAAQGRGKCETAQSTLQTIQSLGRGARTQRVGRKGSIALANEQPDREESIAPRPPPCVGHVGEDAVFDGNEMIGHGLRSAFPACRASRRGTGSTPCVGSPGNVGFAESRGQGLRRLRETEYLQSAAARRRWTAS